MPTLTARERRELPDRAFAYVDREGSRRLPINDEGHVRAALARFNQVQFEDDDARAEAFKRLLLAARKYGIVPIGFMTRQMRAGSSAKTPKLPTGLVTLLFTDIEASTGLLEMLGDGYIGILNDVRSLMRDAVGSAGGRGGRRAGRRVLRGLPSGLRCGAGRARDPADAPRTKVAGRHQ